MYDTVLNKPQLANTLYQNSLEHWEGVEDTILWNNAIIEAVFEQWVPEFQYQTMEYGTMNEFELYETYIRSLNL